MKKRVLSLFLALGLLMGLMTVPANAWKAEMSPEGYIIYTPETEEERQQLLKDEEERQKKKAEEEAEKARQEAERAEAQRAREETERIRKEAIHVEGYFSVETMKYEGEDIKVYMILPGIKVYRDIGLGEHITATAYRATVDNGVISRGEVEGSYDSTEEDNWVYWTSDEAEIGSYFLFNISAETSSKWVGLYVVSPKSATAQGGVTQVVTNEQYGTSVTLNNCLRKVIYSRYGVSQTIYVVADHAMVTVEKMEGRKYVTSQEDYDKFLNDMHGDSDTTEFAYDGSYVSGMEDVYEVLEGPRAYIASPVETEKEETVEMKERFGVCWMCESDFAKLPTDGKVSALPLDAPPAPAANTAYASTQTVMVDNKPVEFNAYALKDENGNMTNYVKLRDVAQVLNGSAAQFQVGWDGSISITTQQAYTANGSEMVQNFSGDQQYTVNTSPVKVNGKAADMEAITLTDSTGGYTYFKLRDLGKALGFNVSWIDGKIVIDPNSPYSDAN